jgi:hypothetical protein
MKRNDSSYLVFLYRYREMPRAKVGAVRRVYRDRRDYDFMPPTVIRFANIAACNKREAIRTGRPIVTAETITN